MKVAESRDESPISDADGADAAGLHPAVVPLRRVHADWCFASRLGPSYATAATTAATTATTAATTAAAAALLAILTAVSGDPAAAAAAAAATATTTATTAVIEQLGEILSSGRSVGERNPSGERNQRLPSPGNVTVVRSRRRLPTVDGVVDATGCGRCLA